VQDAHKIRITAKIQIILLPHLSIRELVSSVVSDLEIKKSVTNLSSIFYPLSQAIC
jgi:hypothetical protein